MKAWLRNLPVVHRLGLTALFAAITGAVSRFLPTETALHWQAGAAYWSILAGFVLWAWSLSRIFPAAWRALAWQPTDRWGLAAVLVGGGFVLLSQSRGFNLPIVEFDLLGTSMAMHWQRGVFLPQQGGEVNGVFELLVGTANTRPLFFPFLLSVLHDVTGYRPENAFVLNGVLTLLLLGLSYVAGRTLAGWKGGLYAVLAWTALPLLDQSAAGGGADLLNVVMILATALLAGWHIHARDGASLVALVFAGILLSQTLFASSVFLIGIGLTAGLVWTKGSNRPLPWLAVLSPLLLLPLALLHRVLADVPSVPAFSPDHLTANIGHALAHWFNPTNGQPNAPWFSVLGLVALAATLILLPSRLRQWHSQPAAYRTAGIFMGVTLLHFVWLMGFPWARLDDPAFHRLNLPAHLLFALCPALVLALMPRLRPGPDLALVLAGLGLIGGGVTDMMRPGATPPFLPAMDVAWRREFAHRQPEPDYLVLDRNPLLWLAHRVASIPIEQARSNPEAITAALRERQFSAVYVFQRFDREPVTGALSIHPEDDLGPVFALETVSEHTLPPDSISRLSRVVVTPPVQAASTPKFPTAPPKKFDEFPLEEWIKKLP